MICVFCHMLIHCLCKLCLRHALSIYCMPGTWLGTDHMAINKIHNKTKQHIKTRSSDKLSQSRLLNRRQWHPTPVILPGKSHGWRTLVGIVHGVAKSQTRLSDFTFTFHFHALKKEMATHSSVLAWRTPGTGEPGGLPSMGSHRVGHY